MASAHGGEGGGGLSDSDDELMDKGNTQSLRLLEERITERGKQEEVQVKMRELKVWRERHVQAEDYGPDKVKKYDELSR